MPYVSMIVGLLLIGVGSAGYFGTGTSSMTALIPAFLGLPLLLLGVLALKETLLKHAMHAAAMIGLIGFIGSAAMALPKLPALVSEGKVVRADGSDATNAVTSQAVTALISGVFVALCVNSFIQARRRRATAEKP